MPLNNNQIVHALLRRDLLAFVEKVFHTVSPGDVYLPNWHVAAIAYALENCLNGTTTRLIITQPPRSLKSICTSVALVAWAMGHDPTRRFICVSYSNELSLELARQFRLVVTSDWYRELFPSMRLARDAGTEVVTTRGGSRLATSIGGTLTGRGADFILIDDPLKASEAASEVARKQVKDWYSSTLATRLDDKDRGVIILVMQRLHEEDLAGHLLCSGSWSHLDLPAIALEDSRIPIGTGDDYHRPFGEVLHEERESRTTLDAIKNDLGSLAFSAQYQQRPVPLEGNLVKRKWFRNFTEPPSGPGVRTVQSWDVAGTTGERSDWSVCTTWKVDRKDFYLVHVWRDRVEFPDLKRKVVELHRDFNAHTVLIEEAGLGQSLVQDLRDDSPVGFPRPIGIKPKGDKVTRMEAQSVKIEAGQVLLPHEAPWLDTFLHEVLGFPNARHDDQVDSLSQFLGWKRRNRFDGIALTRPQIIYIEDDHDFWSSDTDFSVTLS